LVIFEFAEAGNAVATIVKTKAKQKSLCYSGGRLDLAMVSLFKEPLLQLGVRASEIMASFYQAIQDFPKPNLNDLLTQGGNSYADLKLTIKTFGGNGSIEITPGALITKLQNLKQTVGDAKAAKTHFAWSERTLAKAIDNVEISERLLRASIWLRCDGGTQAVERFLNAKGNAAFKLDAGSYEQLQKEFTLQFSGLDASRATKVSLLLQRSVVEWDLYFQYDHTLIGSPVVAVPVAEQFDEGEKELRSLMEHLGLKQNENDA
jgi:hypothetical protein